MIIIQKLTVKTSKRDVLIEITDNIRKVVNLGSKELIILN